MFDLFQGSKSEWRPWTGRWKEGWQGKIADDYLFKQEKEIKTNIEGIDTLQWFKKCAHFSIDALKNRQEETVGAEQLRPLFPFLFYFLFFAESRELVFFPEYFECQSFGITCFCLLLIHKKINKEILWIAVLRLIFFYICCSLSEKC